MKSQTLSLLGKAISFLVRLGDGKLGVSMLNILAKNKDIDAFGEVASLKTDRASQTVELGLLLKGESNPITITVNHYALTTSPSTCSLHVRQVTVSREWLDAALNSYIEFPVDWELPAELAPILKEVL